MDELEICGECYALVESKNLIGHMRWHEDLKFEVQGAHNRLDRLDA